LYWYQRNVEEAPTDLEAWMPLAFYYYERKMWQHCYQAAIKVTELSLESNNHYVADGSMPWRMYDLLAIACWNLGKKVLLRSTHVKRLNVNPGDERLVKNYAVHDDTNCKGLQEWLVVVAAQLKTTSLGVIA